MNINHFKERAVTSGLFGISFIAIASVLLITFFVFKEGWPITTKFGWVPLLTGTEWAPDRQLYGLLPAIVGSCYVTAIALGLGIPLGIGCAIFMAEISPDWMAKVIRPSVNLLAGIPSVIYGFFGLVVLVPFLGQLSLLAGGLILTIMILPTVISITEDALRAVPREFKEASLALGATHWQTIHKVLIPAARSGIIAAMILAMGRALGETMAVIMITGNTPLIPTSIFDYGRTLPGTIGLESAYASGEHAQALFMVGIVLFVMIMIINSTALFFSRKKVSG